jgi:hypothetical protein
MADALLQSHASYLGPANQRAAATAPSGSAERRSNDHHATTQRVNQNRTESESCPRCAPSVSVQWVPYREAVPRLPVPTTLPGHEVPVALYRYLPRYTAYRLQAVTVPVELLPCRTASLRRLPYPFHQVRVYGPWRSPPKQGSVWHQCSNLIGC